jgi:hypothetical protein
MFGPRKRARIFKRLWSPEIEIDRNRFPPAYVAWRPGTTNMGWRTGPQAGNRFLGFLKCLQIRV